MQIGIGVALGNGGKVEPFDGLLVYPDDDLAAVVNGAAEGTTVYLVGDGSAFYDYDIGEDILAPADGVTVTGPEPVLTLVSATYGVYSVAPKVGITGSGGQIFDLSGSEDVTLYGLDIHGATYDGSTQTTGRGIHGQCTGGLVDHCLIRDNTNQGIGGNFGGIVRYTELKANSSAAVSGVSAAIKGTNPYRCEHVYVHDNFNYGLWQDCEGTDWHIRNFVIKDNYASGLFYEISKGLGTTYGGVVVEDGILQNNNTGNVAGRGGMIYTSSKNGTVRRVEFVSNLNQNLRIWEDGRFQNGSNGCSSGYYLENVLIEDCTFTGLNPRLIFNGQSTVTVSADATYDNPHASAPPTADVEFSGNDYA